MSQSRQQPYSSDPSPPEADEGSPEEQPVSGQPTGRSQLRQSVVVLTVVGVGLFAVGLVAGLALVGRHGGGPLQGWDNRVQGWDVSHRAGLAGAAKVVAFAGDAPKLAVIVVVLTGVLVLVTRSITSLVPLVAYLGGELLVFLIREIVHRPRPPTADYPALWAVPGVHETSYSFPSGHSVAVPAVLFAVLGSVALARGWIWPWFVALVASVFVIDTRLVLGVHWLSDVVFGLLIGAAWGTTVAVVFASLTWEDLRTHRPGRGRRPGGLPARGDVPTLGSAPAPPGTGANRTGADRTGGD